MSRRIEDLLHHKHGFPADGVARLADDDIRGLVGMVRAGDGQTNRVRALDLLVASGAKPTWELLVELLERDDQDPLLSAAAAAHVTRFPAAQAETLLLDVLQARGRPTALPCGEADAGRPSPLVLTKVVAALGRCGGRSAMPALKALTDDRDQDPMVSARARFALTLIACREGLRGFEPAQPEARALHVDDKDGGPVRFQAASARDVDVAVQALAGRLFGAQPDRTQALHLACGAQRLLLLPNQVPDGARLTQLVLERPWLAGLVTVQAAEDRSQSVWRIVLAHPQDSDRVRLTVHRTDGSITMEGQARVEGDSAAVALHTLALPGATAATVEAQLRGNTLEILRARSGSRRLPANSPQPWLPPRG